MPKKKPSRIGSKSSYERYLYTDKWKLIREEVIKRDDGRCTKCGAKRNLHVHHLTYKNLFHEENHLEDLITICKKCHKKEHKIKEPVKKKRKAKPKPKKKK